MMTRAASASDRAPQRSPRYIDSGIQDAETVVPPSGHSDWHQVSITSSTGVNNLCLESKPEMSGFVAKPGLTSKSPKYFTQGLPCWSSA